ncbi:MAG: elongation factor P maturation arginine rhamnosyltransferase EarP [Burkholderiaceae bacterium]|nr:elongation factor P maturation arginine rhamnosyltransferase EarP [Burkholderiaceae bacterium]
MPLLKTLHLFCRVVDNYGDIGICWRLSTQLQREHGIAVTLWVDDLASFHRICPEVDAEAATQEIAGITVRHWRKDGLEFTAADVADIVIEFFAVDIPENYIAAMALRNPRPVWINFEGLSAEEWVEGCHTLPSPHPRLPLTKHFFFPGYTGKTGGLLHERGLEQQRLAFQSDRAVVSAFLARLGMTEQEMAATKVSMFCYPCAPLEALFDVWQHGSKPMVCLVPEGVATEQVAAFMGKQSSAGVAQTRGALTVRVLPFLPQPDYDKLLWACDYNFVRGEDSWVRAQWAGRPFVWHIYPQDENLHHVKLRAFLQRYAPDIGSLNELTLQWNAAAGEPEWAQLWHGFQADAPKIAKRAEEWVEQLLKIGDLTSNLLKFCEAVHMKSGQSTL